MLIEFFQLYIMPHLFRDRECFGKNSLVWLLLTLLGLSLETLILLLLSISIKKVRMVITLVNLYFLHFIVLNDMLDVGYVGFDFTWCYNQSGLARHWARLDRCLINTNWTTNFDSYVVKHLLKTFLNHSPLLLTAVPYSFCKNKTFRFDNYCLITLIIML